MTIATHWKDARGLVISDEFRSGPKSSSDWRAAYNVPVVNKRGKFVPIYPCGACCSSGESDGNPCSHCDGIGGLPEPQG